MMSLVRILQDVPTIENTKITLRKMQEKDANYLYYVRVIEEKEGATSYNRSLADIEKQLLPSLAESLFEIETLERR